MDAYAEASNIVFKPARYGDMAQVKFKGRSIILVKPSTYMNLSGKAVNYWLQKEKVLPANMLIIVDDLALPFGSLRMRAKGGDAGHNGLKHINETLGSQQYARVRFGIGSEFGQGRQVDYVLGEWSMDEKAKLKERIGRVAEIINSFVTIGTERTMNFYNNT